MPGLERGAGGDRLLTPSKITAWLDCAHYLTLHHEVDDGTRAPTAAAFGEMARMLLEKGLEHERGVLELYRADGRVVHHVDRRGEHEGFAAWAARVGPALDTGHDVLFQMPFTHDGIRGVADFVERVDTANGPPSYEPVDAKLVRQAAKPAHVLQLCFYAEAIAARIGRRPEHIHLELGSGRRETIRLDDVLPYWRRLRRQLVTLLGAAVGPTTTPQPCDHCAFCEFQQVCEAQWRAGDSLVHVAGMRTADRALLEAESVDTIAALAALDRPVPQLDPGRLTRLVRQADLQVRARQGLPNAAPPYELVNAADTSQDEACTETTEPTLTGFAALPRPDEGDVVLDFEGHPFWRADVGLFFLFGFIERDDQGWAYRDFWAHDEQGEAAATLQLIDYLHDRRRLFPEMHVYHYNHTERTALYRLAQQHAVGEIDLENLVATGAFVDLYPIVTGALQAGVESYGLKSVERLTGFQRSHDIDKGAGAVVEYEHWMRDGDQERLRRIARYNEDDVRATLAVRDWLLDHRPADISWRPAMLDPATDGPDLDARVEALHAAGPGTHDHLMGDLLGYWRRERRVVAADCLRLSMAAEHDQRDSPACVAGLELQGYESVFSPKTGKRLKWPRAVFTFPPQPLDANIGPGEKMIVAINEQQWAFFTLADIDRIGGRLTIAWTQAMLDQGVVPSTLVHFVTYPEGAKLTALCDLADAMIDGSADSVGHAILRNDPPTFVEGRGPDGGLFVGSYEQVCSWAPHLDRSFVAIQGPPGTGKTFTGAHVVRTLVDHGLRVGVTAMSHHAIDNLMAAVVERFTEDGAVLRAVRKAPSATVDGVDYVDDNATCARGDYDVVAGTSWLFASPAMRENPVDVLVVDEAGQLGLADTLAATVSATSVILLGDPQQLPQVAQAAHPNRSGVSVLEHVLGNGAHTIAPDRGVLLDVTFRMHPDVTGFISDVCYDGRLTSHPSCRQQTTDEGTGLRWVRAEHSGRSTESPEEAAQVGATLERLLGSAWTDRDGHTRPLTVADVIVVTPYNDQRRLISALLAANPATAGVEVGTVDKFQGREAAVVVFSMATSSAQHMPRNADFLFSKNRLNVAISRARCLAYLICTDELLDTRARDVDQMTLISALCSFVEQAQPHEP